jgi:transposase
MDEPTLFPLPPADAQSIPPEGNAPPRVQRPNRAQIEWRPFALDQLLPPEHRARVVWHFVGGLDLQALYARIAAVEGEPGRPAIDPQILLALWLYATLEGVGSARAVDRLCTEHVAYQWLCGGVGVNYHTLADFRVQHAAVLDDLLTQSVAVLLKEGLVDLTTVTQDGLKVRASAGAASFRRSRTLRKCLRAAQRQVKRLRQEVLADSGGPTRRQQVARVRAARERETRVRDALAQVAQIEKAKKTQRHTGTSEPRASTTDPEARVMKMSDGGYRPAFNVQLATPPRGRVVVGVEVTNAGNDFGQLSPMLEQLQQRYQQWPTTALVDGGYAKKDDIVKVSAPPYSCTVIAPVQQSKRADQDPLQPRPRDPAAVAAWRVRMGTPEAQALYRQRAATAEWANAQVANRGLTRVGVRGRAKVQAVVLLHALALNLLQGLVLRTAVPAAAT